MRLEVAKAVVGQDAAVSGLLVALLTRGHVLLEGVPGVAKTLLVRSLAAALDVGTKRVQFTPDLMPGDVTGSLVYDFSKPLAEVLGKIKAGTEKGRYPLGFDTGVTIKMSDKVPADVRTAVEDAMGKVKDGSVTVKLDVTKIG